MALRKERVTLMRSTKFFFYSFWLLLLAIICIALPSLIKDREYKNIIILLALLAALVALSVSLFIYFSRVYEFSKIVVFNSKIELQGLRNTLLYAKDIKVIIVTPYRYVFELNSGKSFSLSRIIKSFKLESNVNPLILQFSEDNNIPIVYGTF